MKHNMRHGMLATAFVLLSTLPASEPASEPASPAKIGEKVERLGFKDTRWVSRSLADFKEKKAFVLVFLTVDCPVAGQYLPRLEVMAREYAPRGTMFLGVDSQPDDTLLEVAALALERKITFPLHKDFDQSAMRALGIERTPEVAVLDAEGTLRYRGRVDDEFRVTGAQPSSGRAYLREAIDAVLAGRTPEVTETPVEGCRITARRKPSRDGVNYAEHVAPLLQKHCQSCHRPNQVAPFALLSYDDAKGHAAMIAEVIEERRMPPSFHDPRVGSITTHPQLSNDEVETLLAWTNTGAPRGDPARDPAPLVWPKSEWDIAEPDLILQSKDYKLPATGLVGYKYIVLEPAFEHDSWVSQIQILPSNRRVVHHANLYIEQPGTRAGLPAFITGYVPGGDVTIYDPNTAVRIPAGASLQLQIHYITTGKEEVDRIRVGVVFAKKTVRHEQKILYVINNTFRIPPMDPAFEMRARNVFLTRAHVGALFTHMHVRGRDMTYIARYPNGQSETLLSIPNYSFDWQMAYRLGPEKRIVPPGTVIETISHYDNSPWNPFNPDPTKTVREGQQTHQEMNYGFVFYIDENEQLAIDVDPKTGRALNEKRRQMRL